MAEQETRKGALTDTQELAAQIEKLRAALYGEGNHIGLVARIHRLEEKIDDLTKVGWLLFGTIVTYIAANLLSLI